MNEYIRKPLRCRSGFTLIELSIVLVIIGLIVGGVLIGRDLIFAAQVRRDISTIVPLQTAVRTFQIKYNSLPGDMSNPTQFLRLLADLHRISRRWA